MQQSTITIKAQDRDAASIEGARQLGVEPENVTTEELSEGEYTISLKEEPGKFEISLQPDNMGASLKVIPPPRENGTPVSEDDVLKGLTEKKIVFGIDKEQIRKVVSEVARKRNPQQNVSIAKGEEAKKGEDGRVEFKIGKQASNNDPEAADMVKPGQILAIKIPAGAGTAGQNILGEELPAQPGTDCDFSAEANVTVAKDGVSFNAAIYGRAMPKRESIAVFNLVEESEDNMSATMPLYPILADNSRLTLEDVLTSLKQVGIVQGIREDNIQAALQHETPQLHVVVAEGSPSKDGIDSQIDFGFRLNNGDPEAVDAARQKGNLEASAIIKELVVSGTVLAQKIPLKEPEDGFTILGETLAAVQPDDKSINSGEGVTGLDGGLKLVVADDVIAGYANYADGSVFVEDLIRVSEDDMQVFLTVHPHTEKGKALTEELVNKLLEHRKIIHGISKKVIQKVLEHAATKRAPLYDVVIAKGTEPKRGQDAKIDLTVSFDKKAGSPSENLGRINFRERRFIHNVKKGDILGIKTPAEPGVNGEDVLGRMIPAEAGEDKPLTPMGGVVVSEDGLTYTAEIDGMVSLVETDKIGVFQQYEIAGDVDYSTGNLSMDGTLDIKGWIKTGFTVHATGDILVGAGVEAAIVESGANIVIDGGVIGIEQGKIKARGDIHAHFLERARVYAGGSIFVKDEIMRSKVFAGDLLSVTEGKGRIRGGTVSGLNGVEANELGSEANVKTVVVAGTNFAVQQRLAVVKKQLREYHRKVAKMNKILGRYIDRGKGAKLPKDIVRKLSVLAKKRRDLVRAETRLNKSKKELSRKLSKIDIMSIRIVAKKAVYVGTSVVIGRHVYKIKEDIKRPTTFGLNEKGLVHVLEK